MAIIIMLVCMYVKGRPCGDVHGTDSRLDQGKRSLCGPILPSTRAALARVTPPTSYYPLLRVPWPTLLWALRVCRRVIETNQGYPGPWIRLRMYDFVYVMCSWLRASLLCLLSYLVIWKLTVKVLCTKRAIIFCRAVDHSAQRRSKWRSRKSQQYSGHNINAMQCM